MDKVHVRFLRYSAFYTPLLVTLSGDRLRNADIDVSFDRATPEATVEGGLRDGSVQVAQSAPAVSFRPVLAGETSDLRHFAVMNHLDGFFLAARDRSTPFSWLSLEGRTVLADHFFQPMALLRTAMRRMGVDESRVRIIDAGTPAQMEEAFRAGQGDFVHLQGPAPQQLEADGLAHVVASVGQAAGPLAFSSLFARTAWLQTPVARRFMQVYRESRAESHSGDPRALAELVQPFLPEISRGALERTITDYQRLGTWAGADDISPSEYARTVEIFNEVGHINGTPPMEQVVVTPPV